MEVKDFLDEKSICEENVELVIDHINNRHYLNHLKAARPPDQR